MERLIYLIGPAKGKLQHSFPKSSQVIEVNVILLIHSVYQVKKWVFLLEDLDGYLDLFHIFLFVDK